MTKTASFVSAALKDGQHYKQLPVLRIAPGDMAYVAGLMLNASGADLGDSYSAPCSSSVTTLATEKYCTRNNVRKDECMTI